MNYRYLKNDLGSSCRACLNDKYKLKLKSEHCHYMMYPQLCKNCNEMKNIVVGIRFSKRIGLLFK